jgi:hypothetical protein
MYGVMKETPKGTSVDEMRCDVNANLDSMLQHWETSEDTNERSAAKYFQYWRKKTGMLSSSLVVDYLSTGLTCHCERDQLKVA